MIYMTTGLPGHGKTLLTLHEVSQRAQKEGRPVFYHGIKDLEYEWTALESAEHWITCPVGAIIVIDECQSSFRPRSAGSKVPDYISKFETHRHEGWDIYLITQHPMLVDQNIRRLVGRHRHIIRKFGKQKATAYEWATLHEITERNLEKAQKTEIPYPEEVFNKYKSAELHTVKKQIPKKIYFLYAVPVIVICLLWLGWSQMSSVGKSSPAAQSSSVPQSPQPSQPSRARGGELDTPAYIASYTPRIPGLPWTAPAYDEVTQPADAPYPVACIDGVKGCRCYDQQEARIAVSETFCRDFLERGMFVAWKRRDAAPVDSDGKGQGGRSQTERAKSA